MTSTAMRVIRDEHQAVAAVLRSLKMLVKRSHQNGVMPPFDVLRAMIFYVDEFPERLHRTKETELLFPRVRARRPELGPVIDKLDADHGHGEAAIRELEHLMLAFEVIGESRREAFENALDRYVEAYLTHMTLEDTQIIPAARESLTPEDWAELDAAFAANRDPLTGHKPDAQYARLFEQIVHHTPAPFGLGS
ncbi:MAG: hemerythrin domain-containing protein [Burkholderiaceae bacterium]